MKPLSVYAFIPRHANASYYYRLTVPLETMRDLGMSVRSVIDTDDPSISVEQRVEQFCEADVVLVYQPVGEAQLNNMLQVREFIPSMRDGEWKWPPTIIVETDDNIFDVSPLNPAYKGLGTRDMEGNELPDGHCIGLIENGQRAVKWADGRDGFSIAKNRQLMNVYRKMLEVADAVQCSTPHLEKVVWKEANPRRVKVFPNMVRFDHYEQLDLVQPKDRLNILWQGGHNHYEDWFPLREQLGRITAKYPQVHWLIWGVHYPWVTGLIPPDRYTFINWCHYHEYKLRRVMMNEQISLAPLSPSRFNNCRSAIKWYEASAHKRPAATLAQNTGPYADEIHDGKTGLLFSTPDEFEADLSLLIEDETTRLELAANAKDWVSENRDAFKLTPKIVSYWEQLREERKREQPHVTLDQWEEIAKEAQLQEA